MGLVPTLAQIVSGDTDDPTRDMSNWNLIRNVVNGNIDNDNINASAAIAMSKLATGALPTGITVASANIVNGTIVNADVNAAAAITESKITFSGTGHGHEGTTDGSTLDLTAAAAATAWSTYVPVWTGASSNPAIGNGTITGRYIKYGRLVTATIWIDCGSTTSYGSGNYRVTVPVQAANATVSYYGVAIARDNNTTNQYVGIAGLGANGTYVEFANHTSSSEWQSNAPFTWAEDDTLRFTITYESAS